MQYPTAAMVMQHGMMPPPHYPPQYMPYHHPHYQHHNPPPTPPHQSQNSNGNEENRTLWVDDLDYWMDEEYLRRCFASTQELRIRNAVMYISIAILIVLFCVQRYGTDKVGFRFAPAVCLWFLFISGIGAYNLFKHDICVLRAFNPQYIVNYFQRNGHKAWISLGRVVLCITGTEATFADLGHFNVTAVQISFTGMVFPALLIAYSGQAAYLSKFPEHVKYTFYDSIPG